MLVTSEILFGRLVFIYQTAPRYTQKIIIFAATSTTDSTVTLLDHISDNFPASRFRVIYYDCCKCWINKSVDITLTTAEETGKLFLNPLNPELNPICYLLALLGAHPFLHVSRIRVKLLNFWLLMSYIYGAFILDVSRSHTTTQHSRQDSSGRVIRSSQRPLPDNTRHSQQTKIHATSGIRTHDLSRRAALPLAC